MSPPSPIPKLLRESSDLTITSTSHTSPSNTTVSFIRSHRRSCNPFTRSRLRPRLHLTQQPLFRNSLLAGVGFLELANAADFAANVWNQIPVPRYAMILMAIGGPVALLITLVAARDLYLSYQNVQLLRQERLHLQHLLASSPSSHTTLVIQSRLSVNFRELGTELVDRILMDALMGFGALLVGTGTLMAIWGANHHVYRASNLLSGYIGNGLAALFGVVNSIWSGYLVLRFQRHYKACMASNPIDVNNDYDELDISCFKDNLRLRFRGLQWHAIVNGINGIVAGAASLVTATMWYGYVVLIPCIVSLIACNWFWRVRLGYDRPLLAPTTATTTTTHSPETTTTTNTNTDTDADTDTVHSPPPTTTNTTTTTTTPYEDIPEKTDLITDLATTTHILRTLTSPLTLPLPQPLTPSTSSPNNPHPHKSLLNPNLHHPQRHVRELLHVLDIPSPPTPTTTSTTEKPNHVQETPEDEERIEIILTPTDFLTYGKQEILLSKMNEYLELFGKKAIAYRERWLLEVVGCAVYRSSLASGEGEG
ncbi:hypothetical protein BO94DRAFT_531526, partial [Aspergillus sclerotioniger CBS 115572]